MAYLSTANKLGAPDISSVVTSGNLGDPTVITQLPSVTLEAKLGEEMEAWDSTLGWARFIYLAVPTSTTVTVGLLYQFDKNYTITLLPAKSTSQKTGVAVVAAYTAVTSNATSVQYAWFLIKGQVPVLKTAVAVPPQSAVYISATAGRVYVTSSSGGQLLGARSQNTATATAGVSTVNVYLNYSAMEGA